MNYIVVTKEWLAARNILPLPSEDTYVLDNAILLDTTDTVLLTEDGTPIVYN